MTDTQAQEAARLAALLDAEQVRTVDADVMHSQAAALLRSQAARIAELDEQIAELRKSLQREAQRTHDRNVEIIELHGENKALRAELARMPEPLPVQAAVELVSAHQKAAIELGQEMVDDNHQILIAARVALIDALTAHGITKTGAEAIHQDGVSHG
jgi:hypothetical protein